MSRGLVRVGAPAPAISASNIQPCRPDKPSRSGGEHSAPSAIFSTTKLDFFFFPLRNVIRAPPATAHVYRSSLVRLRALNRHECCKGRCGLGQTAEYAAIDPFLGTARLRLCRERIIVWPGVAFLPIPGLDRRVGGQQRFVVAELKVLTGVLEA